MTSASLWAAGCLVLAALAVALPLGRPHARRRLATLFRRDVEASLDRQHHRSCWHPPLWTIWLGTVSTLVAVATVAGGPVAGFATGAYCGVASRVARRRRADKLAAGSRARALDALYCLAADLRAGAAPPASGFSAVSDNDRLAWLAGALRQVAEQTGAPLADLLERAAADARATDRIAAAAAAAAAGAQATAWLLAALPAAGIALGYAIGADPLRVLLHTPIGAGCAAGAIALQIAGLEWADRIVRPASQTPAMQR